jgi:hypothetical protein
LVAIGLLFLLLIATTLTQIAHAWGIGNFSFRYFLPAILVFSLFITYGLLEIRKARGQLLGITVVAMAITSLATTARLENTERWVPAVGATNNIMEKLQIALTHNGFPSSFLVLLMALLICGTIATIAALFMLTQPNNLLIKKNKKS